jgi:L-iditol 2-dehydrogenase
MLIPATWLHRLPDNISFEEGALLEPLNVALAAVTRAELRLGMSTLRCGAGPIGLAMLLCAATAGCEPLIITDLDQGRLHWAQKLVPRVHTVQISKTSLQKILRKKSNLTEDLRELYVLWNVQAWKTSVPTAI